MGAGGRGKGEAGSDRHIHAITVIVCKKGNSDETNFQCLLYNNVTEEFIKVALVKLMSNVCWSYLATTTFQSFIEENCKLFVKSSLA